MSTRRQARERALQALYAFELGGGSAEHIIETVIKGQFDSGDEAIAFATKLFILSLDRAEEADRIIERHTQNWELSRIALVDRLVLRMALCEFLSFEDIPPKVTINEAIDVAKRYSTLRSGQFVNGILDAALAALRDEGRIRKRGRGLVDVDTGNSSGS